MSEPLSSAPRSSLMSNVEFPVSLVRACSDPLLQANPMSSRIAAPSVRGSVLSVASPDSIRGLLVASTSSAASSRCPTHRGTSSASGSPGSLREASSKSVTSRRSTHLRGPSTPRKTHKGSMTPTALATCDEEGRTRSDEAVRESTRMSQRIFRRRSDEGSRRKAAEAVLPKPDRKAARLAGRAALLTQDDGSLYPLYTHVGTFDRFGTDVSQYFHFMYHSKSFFVFLFLINLSNIIVNIEGNAYGFQPFTMHTLGNTARDGVLSKGGHSYAVMEFLSAGLMIAYLFWIRGEMETIYDRVRGSGQQRKLAAADFTVMVGNIDRSWGSAQVRAFFEKSFGDVVHVGLSLDYRQLIQAVHTTRALKDRHNDLLLYLVQVVGAAHEGDAEGPAKQKALAKVTTAREAVMKSMRKLEEHDRHIKGLMRARYRCTGYAFVTFDKLLTAQAVKKSFHRGGGKMASYLRILGGGLTVHPAPEPHDVIWENLQCSPREVLVRQVVSCVIMFVLCMLGTVILWLTNALLIWDHEQAAFQWVKDSQTASFFAGIGIWLLSVLLIVIGHLVLIISVIVMANVLERPHTHADKEISVMVKISFFQARDAPLKPCCTLPALLKPLSAPRTRCAVVQQLRPVDDLPLARDDQQSERAGPRRVRRGLVLFGRRADHQRPDRRPDHHQWPHRRPQAGGAHPAVRPHAQGAHAVAHERYVVRARLLRRPALFRARLSERRTTPLAGSCRRTSRSQCACSSPTSSCCSRCSTRSPFLCSTRFWARTAGLPTVSRCAARTPD